MAGNQMTKEQLAEQVLQIVSDVQTLRPTHPLVHLLQQLDDAGIELVQRAK